MTLNEYQEMAMSTCMPSSENICYMLFNLQGEIGEFSSKIAKAVRKGYINIGLNYDDADGLLRSTNDIDFSPMIAKEGPDAVEAFQQELMKEAGDIAWQLAGLCHVMGWDLESVCYNNILKLADRKTRGKIDGEGDNR